METWEMIKTLSESMGEYGFTNRFFIEDYDKENTLIAYLKEVGSVEFEVYDLEIHYKFKTNNVTLYPTYSWREISKEEAYEILKLNK